MTDGLPQIAFGGDRALSVRVLEFLLSAGCVPRCLLLPEPGKASHDVELAAVFRKAGGSQIHRGREIFSARALQCLRDAELDYIVLVHLQLMIPPEMLAVPRHGVLNLHPAYLPHNRGWHTPSWAILDGTPFGATLHFLDERIDCGDIVHQRQLDVEPADTADSLYRKALDLEFEVFREAWPALAARTYQRRPQPPADAFGAPQGRTRGSAATRPGGRLHPRPVSHEAAGADHQPARRGLLLRRAREEVPGTGAHRSRLM